MYLRGTASINLKGTQVQLMLPKDFFGGVANLIRKGSWLDTDARVQQETFKLMAVVQSTNEVLRECGVDNVVRVAIGDTVIYEDFENVPNDLDLAMEALQRKVKEGLELGYLDRFDYILKRDDGVLSYVIDFDIYRQHRPDVDPIVIHITALSSELKRKGDESTEAYSARTERYFASQEAFDQFRQRLQTHFEEFLKRIKEGFKRRLGIEGIQVETETRVVRKQRSVEAGDYEEYIDYGYPFYGYDSESDLYYLWYWHNLTEAQALHQSNFTYVEPSGGIITEVAEESWGTSDFEQFDGISITEGADASGVSIDTGATVIGSGSVEETESIGDIASDSGGWLDSIGDLDLGDFDIGGFDF